MNKIQFYPRTDLVVIRKNPEQADVSNPNGEIIGHHAMVVAEWSDGRRKVKSIGSFVKEQPALDAAQALADQFSVRPPDDLEKWFGHDPRYGSPAWEREATDWYHFQQERVEG